VEQSVSKEKLFGYNAGALYPGNGKNIDASSHCTIPEVE
jgi:hypothetical protein